MQLISSASTPPNLRAYSTKLNTMSSLHTISYFIFLRTKNDISESFM